jgi:hypothetical protein
VNSVDLSTQDRDECGCLFGRPADRHEVLDTALVHHLPHPGRWCHDDQGAVVLAKLSESLDENAESQSVDPGEQLEVDHDRSGLLTQVVERLAEGRCRIGSEFTGQRNDSGAGRVTNLNIESHRVSTLLRLAYLVADGPNSSRQESTDSVSEGNARSQIRRYFGSFPGSPQVLLNKMATEPGLVFVLPSSEEPGTRFSEGASGFSGGTTGGETVYARSEI